MAVDHNGVVLDIKNNEEQSLKMGISDQSEDNQHPDMSDAMELEEKYEPHRLHKKPSNSSSPGIANKIW